MEMDKQTLKKLCKDNGLYSTPSINDKIYLHYKGFRKIENLEEYTGLKCLWLEGNGLDKMEGMEAQVLLRSLYLHENLFTEIEGLEQMIELDTLNLSKNYISKIKGLEKNTKLTNLNLANNVLTTSQSIEHILKIPSLQTLDIQHNKVDDPAVVDILEQLPDLRVLYLMGNPVVKKIPHYRKTLIYRIKNLKYLDDRPVFDEERRRTIAWYQAFLEGGVQAAQVAERAEIDAIRDEKKAADERNFRAMEEMMREGLAIRAEREAAAAAAAAEQGLPPPPPTSSAVNVFTGETVIPVPESDEVRKVREERLEKLRTGANMPPVPPDSDGNSDLPPVPPLQDENHDGNEKPEADVVADEDDLTALD